MVSITTDEESLKEKNEINQICLLLSNEKLYIHKRDGDFSIMKYSEEFKSRKVLSVLRFYLFQCYFQ